MATIDRFPVAPLLAVDGAQVSVLVRPLVPDPNVPLLEPADVGVAAEEPQQLDDDRPQVQLLRREQRESLGEVETHLRPEAGQGAGSGAVLLLDALVENLLHEIEILAHAASP